MEGPSIVIFIEEAAKFVGKKPKSVTGSTQTIDLDPLKTRTLRALRSWGKHLLLDFGDRVVRIHFLMYGSYRIDEEKEGRAPRLALQFSNGALRFYSCSIKLVEGILDEVYDWRVDVMSDEWDEDHVATLVAERKDDFVCDVILNQALFAGAGNIIKNEVLFRLRLHPQVRIKDLTAAKRRNLIHEVRDYSQHFYSWKKQFELKKHWQMYRKKRCPVCDSTTKLAKTGTLERRTFWCPSCQRKPTV